MNKKQFDSIVVALGAPAGDYSKHFAAGLRPYQVVNQVQTEKLVSAADELDVMSREAVLLSEDPTTCGLCGTRTDFVELPGGKQHHTCGNCQYEFVGEEDGDDGREEEAEA